MAIAVAVEINRDLENISLYNIKHCGNSNDIQIQLKEKAFLRKKSYIFKER